MNTVSVKTRGKIFYLDLLRAIGCLAVVLLHVSSIFTLEPYGSANYILGYIFDIASQFAVPLFVMISGALYLSEEYSFTTKKMLGHIKKLGFFYLGWSVLYTLVFTVFKNLLMGIPVTIARTITEIITGPYHLWFIPMMIGLYVITPFLRLWVKEENRKYVHGFILLGFVFNFVIPTAQYFTEVFIPGYSGIFDVVDAVHFAYGAKYVFYFVLGWYLHQVSIHYVEPICCLGILGLLMSIGGTMCFSDVNGNTSFFFGNFSCGTFFYTVAIFVAVKSIFHESTIRSKFVDLICSSSLGIYAMHVGVFPLFSYILKIHNAALAIPLYFLIAVMLPLAGSVVIKKIKFLSFLV